MFKQEGHDLLGKLENIKKKKGVTCIIKGTKI